MKQCQLSACQEITDWEIVRKLEDLTMGCVFIYKTFSDLTVTIVQPKDMNFPSRIISVG